MAIRTKHQNETVSTDSDVWQYGQNTRTRQWVQTQMYDNVRTKQQKKTASTDRLRCMAIRTKHQNKTVSTDSNAWQYRQNTRTRQCVQTQMFGITDKRPEQDSEYRLGCMAIQTKHQNQTASTDYMRCKVIRTKHQNKTVSTGSDV